jgi:hypothetical protein
MKEQDFRITSYHPELRLQPNFPNATKITGDPHIEVRKEFSYGNLGELLKMLRMSFSLCLKCMKKLRVMAILSM